MSRLILKFLGLCAIFLALLAGTLFWVWATLPDVSALLKEYPLVIYRGPDEPPLVKIQKDRPPGWVSLGNISREGQGAIVVSEDWAFFQHEGYDPNMMKEAFDKDLERHKFSHGASTITQQVVRNVFLSKEKSLLRKGKELYLAVKLNSAVPKKRVLEIYLNIAEWGEGVYGIGAASRLYFGKTPDLLTAREGAFLAMLLPSPIRYSQSFRHHELTPYARKIVNSVLGKMVQAQYLAPEQLPAQRTAPFAFENSASASATVATKAASGSDEPDDTDTDTDPDTAAPDAPQAPAPEATDAKSIKSRINNLHVDDVPAPTPSG